MGNPIIDEVRLVRDEHARKFNYDLAAKFAKSGNMRASSCYIEAEQENISANRIRGNGL